jgi:hypothetical protein
MASAEQLLNDAQYAFQSISVGDTRENRRNAALAKSLCKKIFRKYPGTSEAVVAHGIMMRLGEESFGSRLAVEHQHESHATAHDSRSSVPRAAFTPNDEIVPFDWNGLFLVIKNTPRTVTGVLLFVVAILFGFFGAFVFLPLAAFILLSGPFRQLLGPQQRQNMNTFVTAANAHIEKRRQSNAGQV